MIRSLCLCWQSRLCLFFLLLRYVYFFLYIHISSIMMRGWHQKVASFLALLRPYVAVCRQLVIATWEFICRVFVHINFLFVLCSFYMVSLQKHFHFQAKIGGFWVRSNSQEIEAVLFIHSIFHVVVLFSVDFEELIVLGIISQSCGFL